MRIVDFFHTLLKSSVEVMVAVADVLGSAAGAAAHARRTGVDVPAAPAAWQARGRQLHTLAQPRAAANLAELIMAQLEPGRKGQ